MNRQLTKRALRGRRERATERLQLESRHCVEQTSPGFVPPTPDEAEKNRLLARLNKKVETQQRAHVKLDALKDNAELIAMSHTLDDGTLVLPDVHPKDRADVLEEVRRRAEHDLLRLPRIVIDVADEYRRRRERNKVIARLTQELNVLFKRGSVSPTAGVYWIVSELVHLRHPLGELQSKAGAALLDVSRETFEKGAAKTAGYLARSNVLDQAKGVIRTHGDLYPFSDAEYDAMIGPTLRTVDGRAYRSVEDVPKADPSLSAAARERTDKHGRRAFNPMRIKGEPT
jgi:hypothetical protein